MTVIDLNTTEGKAELKRLIDEATDGLVRKRDELLNELKPLREKIKGVEPVEFYRLKDENEQRQAKISESENMVKKINADLEMTKKAMESESGFVQKLLIENGLTEALNAAGVKPELSKAVKAMFAGQAQIRIDGENRNAVIGDKSLSDFIAEWSRSDEGKHFVTASVNSGGGANGSGGANGASKTMTRADFDAKQANGSHAELTSFFANGVK